MQKNPNPIKYINIIQPSLTQSYFGLLQELERMAGSQQVWGRPTQIFQLSVRGNAFQGRSGEVQKTLTELFQVCRHECICEDSTCSFRSGTASISGDPSPRCQSDKCDVCDVFGAQPEDLYIKSVQTKNERLNQLLCCCPAISELYRLVKRASTQTPLTQHKRDVQTVLCKLVQCGENKLNCMKNIGELAEIVPNILCVQLTSGYSEFWTELRKVAKALNKQQNEECKIAALVAIRKHLPPGNPWSYYLSTSDPRLLGMQADILQRWMAALSPSSSTWGKKKTLISSELHNWKPVISYESQ